MVFGNATKPAGFAHFCQGAQSLAPATRNNIWTSRSAPYPLVFCTFDFEMCFAPQRRALVRHLNFQKWSEPLVFFLTLLTWKCASRHDGVHFSTSELPKVVRTWCVLYILTSKCASRHNGVHFLDISTSKSGPNMVCFVHFDFEMCFTPQWRAIFISHLASRLRTRRFSEPTFRPSGATNHWKNTVFRDFPTFSRICLFFLLTLSLLWFFSLLLFSSLWLFPSLLFICPYCRKFDF